MLQVQFGNITFQNPVIAASGTFSPDFEQHFDLSRLGGICSKGLTLYPRAGNKGIRIWETASGIMNSVGLENKGVDLFIQQDLPILKKLKDKGVRIIINVSGSTEEEYLRAVELFSKEEVDIIELNISCPNIKGGGMLFGMTSYAARELVRQVRKITSLPLVIKLTPNADNIVKIAQCCEEEGADGLSLVNTFNAMAIDVKKRKPAFNNVYAGLSGPAIKPIALRMVHEVCQKVKIPVIGIGGITNGRDALEFVMAGATCLQVGTANFMNPFSCARIIEDIENFLREEGIESLEEIRGIL
ncbi:MAG: dihydroorotate dehydrogenase [Candidatus Atribacteria bacterium]|nr:dihydroorotate dehydrogenase [Candidatus Atribacteria bacterium]